MLWNCEPLGCPTQARKRHWAICGDSRIDQVGAQLQTSVLLSTLLEGRLRQLTSCNWAVGFRERIRRPNEHTRGWLAHLSLADIKNMLEGLDLLRRSPRVCVWVRWMRVRTHWRKLRAPGVSESRFI